MINWKCQEGFTLIEVVIALGVLSIGILSVMVMQVMGIRGNSTANTITIESNWASDRIERLLTVNYDDLDDVCRIGNLNDQSVPTGTATEPAKKEVSPDGRFTIFCNFEHYLTPYPTTTDSTVKAIRVFVQSNNAGIQNEVVLNYYKQKLF